MWSYGVLCFEILTRGQTPYKGMSNKQVMEFVMSDKKLSRPEQCPEWLYDIMLKCWERDPQSRPTFRRIRKLLHQRLQDEVLGNLEGASLDLENEHSTITYTEPTGRT